MGRNPFEGCAPARPIPKNGGPNFRNQQRVIGNQVVTSAIVVFRPETPCTVQWVLVQTSVACVIQPTLNNAPFGAALNVGANAIIRFAGALLANNDALGFTVSVQTTLSFEVVWIKELRPDLIENTPAIASNGTSTGGTTNANIFDSTGATLLSDGASHLQVTVRDTAGHALPGGDVDARSIHVVTPAPVLAINPGGDALPILWNAPATSFTSLVVTPPSGYRGAMVTLGIKPSVANISATVSLQRQYSAGLFIAWAATAALPLGNVGIDNFVTLAMYPTLFNGALGGAGGTVQNAPMPNSWRLVFGFSGTGWVNPNTATLDFMNYDWLP